MTMGDQVTVTMTGGGPYGFRLFGGENIPLSVAKIRRRSKSAEAGLSEGDILLGINGYSCRGVSHATAMALAESSGDMLVFQILRGADDQQSVEAAFQSLGGQLAAIPASALQASMSAVPRPMINSHVTPASQYHHQEERTVQQTADTTTRVTRETRTETQGDSTYLQTTTQSSVSTTTRAASPLQPLQNAARPNTWQPPSSGGRGGVQSVRAPQKENVAPKHAHVPMFKVSKVTNAVPESTWNPSMGSRPALRTAPPPARSPSPMNVAPTWQPPPPPPQPPRQPSPMVTVDLGMDVALQPSDFRSADPVPMVCDDQPRLPIQLHKLMFGGRDSECSTPDSPCTLARKKKIYADSSFYDDPEHKYPTIEEQIKMARGVALSLMAPQNKRARGHTMFMKRRQGANRWIAGEELGDQMDLGISFQQEGEKYYRPAPWKADHTWQAPPQQQQPRQQYQQPQYQPPVQQPQYQPPQPQEQVAADPYERGWGQPDIDSRTWGVQQQQQPQQPPWGAALPPPQPAPPPPPPKPPTPGLGRNPSQASNKPFHTWQPKGLTAPKSPPFKVPTPTPEPLWDQPESTWKPPPSLPMAPAPMAPPPAPAMAPSPIPPPPPPAPPLPDDSMKTMWRTSMPIEERKSDSYDQFEKVRLLDSKNLHNQVSPQICFSLANDLRSNKGRGGKLFAKRQARAEQWVVDAQPLSTGPNKVVMEKIAGQVAMEQARQNANIKSQVTVKTADPGPVSGKPRLQEMIAKPEMTPWQAAAEGNLEQAFTHLNKRSTIHGDSTVSQGWNPPKQSPAGPTSAGSVTALAPAASASRQPALNYNNKIQGWGAGSGASGPSNIQPSPKFSAGGASSLLSPSRQPKRVASPCYQTPPQQLSPHPLQAAPPPAAPPAMAPAEEVFYDAATGYPDGFSENLAEGYSDL